MKVDMSNAHIHMTLRSRHRPCLLSEALLVDKHGPIWNIPMGSPSSQYSGSTDLSDDVGSTTGRARGSNSVLAPSDPQCWALSQETQMEAEAKLPAGAAWTIQTAAFRGTLSTG